jgi:hypothetical protein
MFGANSYVDYLIIGKDTLEVFSRTIEVQVSDISKFPYSETEYQIYWKLEDKRLYLVRIVNRNGESRIEDLSLIFGNDFINGRVFANWVSGEIIHPQGKWFNFVEVSTSESEDVYLFDKGSFIKNYKYDNSKTYKSIFTQNNDSLFSFISNTINWETIPSIDNRVVLSVVSGEEKDKFQISVIKGIDSLYNNEALRVAKLIPAWDVLYIHGQMRPTNWVIPINFSNEMRLKYKRK